MLIICHVRVNHLKNATKSLICVLGGLIIVAFDNNCYGSPVWLQVFGIFHCQGEVTNFQHLKQITPWLLVSAEVLSDADSSFALFCGVMLVPLHVVGVGGSPRPCHFIFGFCSTMWCLGQSTFRSGGHGMSWS